MSDDVQGAQEPTRFVTGQYTVTMNITDKRGVTIVGSLFNDDTAADVNRRIDMAQDVIDRQFVRGDIINKKAQIVAMRQHLVGFKQSMEGMLEQKRVGKKKLTSQQESQISTYDTSLAQMASKIEELTADIAAGEKRLAETV